MSTRRAADRSRRATHPRAVTRRAPSRAGTGPGIVTPPGASVEHHRAGDGLAPPGITEHSQSPGASVSGSSKVTRARTVTAVDPERAPAALVLAGADVSLPATARLGSGVGRRVATRRRRPWSVTTASRGRRRRPGATRGGRRPVRLGATRLPGPDLIQATVRRLDAAHPHRRSTRASRDVARRRPRARRRPACRSRRCRRPWPRTRGRPTGGAGRRRPRRGARRAVRRGGAHVVEPATRRSRTPRSRPREPEPARCSSTSSARELERVVVDEVGLGERDHAVVHVEQVEDAQVLLALRHPPFVGGDHEHRDVDRADTGEHVLDEAHVARHVDEADLGPDGSVQNAKPRSIVRPRAFSSGKRSGSVPVSARRATTSRGRRDRRSRRLTDSLSASAASSAATSASSSTGSTVRRSHTTWSSSTRATIAVRLGSRGSRRRRRPARSRRRPTGS